MLAIDVLSLYIENHPYGLAESTQSQLRWTFNSISKWHGSCGLDTFTCAVANAWIDHLRESKRPDTVRTQRTNLLCVWWWAYREQYVQEPPLRLRKLRPIRHEPTAWRIDEVRSLIHAAQTDPLRPAFWESLVRSGYDTGLRLGDLLFLRVDQVSKLVHIRQHKTGHPVAVQLRPETLKAVERQISGRELSSLVWPLWGRREAFYRAFRGLVVRSGIRPGTFRWLRRTAATQVETISPGAGTALLGHASRSTTETWYIDRSQLTRPPLPPW